MFGEFFLIVAGVSVALAAESAWGIRKDRILESEYLAQIQADLAENEKRLLVAIALEEMQRAAAQAAFDAVSERRPIPPDSANAWLHERRGLNYSDPRLLTGSVSALIGTGDVRLVRDPVVRKAIMAYLPQISADQAEFDRWVEHLLMPLERLRAVGLRIPLSGYSHPSPSVRAVSATSPDPEVLTALDGIKFSHGERLLYLNRMLAATRELADELLQPR
jgi:hypothetical protein